MAAKTVVFEIDIKGAKQVFELQKQIGELKKALKKEKDPTIADDLIKQLLVAQNELKKAQTEARKAQKEFEAKDETVGGYKRLSAELYTARERFKNLATQAERFGNVSQKELEQARQDAARLDAQLKRVDAATGVFSRNVGNYAGSLKGLFGSLKQSIQASGLIGRGGIGNFIGQLQGAFQKVTEAIEAYNTAFSASYNISKQVEKATEGVINEYVSERIELDTLSAALVDENTTREQKQQALAALQEQYPDYFSNLDLETLTVQDLKKAYDAANASLLENIKTKAKAQVLQELANEAIKAELKSQADAQKAAINTGDLLINAAIDVASFWSDASAETAKAAVNIQDVDKAVEKVGDSISKTFGDFDLAIGNLDELTKKAADKTDKAAADIAKKQLEAAKKAAEELRKAQEKAAADAAKFNADQAKAFETLQKELSQAIIDNIEDEGTRAKAQETANFTLRKAEREAQYKQIIADTEAQEAELIRVFGENSVQVLDFRKENAERLRKLEKTYNDVQVEDEKAHQNKLTDITKQGEAERTAEEAAEQQKRLDQDAAYVAELDAILNDELAAIDRQLRTKQITVEQADAARIEATKKSVTEQLAIIQSALTNETELTDQQRAELVAKRKQLNNELLDLEIEQTEQAANEADKRQAKQQETINFVLNTAQQVLGAIGGLADAIGQKEIKQLDEQIAARGKNIENLQERLEDAAGYERAYLEQKIEEEERAAEAIAAAKERAEKEAATVKKALAITQAVINTALSVTQALLAPPGVPYTIPFGVLAGALGAVQIATIAAQPLATGGIVGQEIKGRSITRSNGDNVLTTLKTGEAVLTTDQQQRIGYHNLALAGVPGFALGGIVPSVPSLPPAINASSDQFAQLTDMIMETRNLAIATNNRIDRQEIVYTPNTQRQIDSANKDRKEIQTTAKL